MAALGMTSKDVEDIQMGDINIQTGQRDLRDGTFTGDPGSLVIA